MYYRLGAFLACVMLLFSACNSYKSKEFTRYYDDGRIKPKVALVPILQQNSFPYPWDLSRELTENIRSEVLELGSLFLPAEVSYMNRLSTYSGDVLSLDPALLESLRQDHDFVAFLELLEHSEERYKGQPIKPVYTVYGEVANLLKITMRLSIYDLRGSTPKQVLSEIVHSNHMISKEGAETDYHKVLWQTDAYKTSPYGLAHSRLSKEVADRMAQYITVARS